MGKGRDRSRRRHGFDDEPYSGFDPREERSPPAFARAPQEAGGPPVDATVKWFNPEKGFGFVALADGSSDAFLHIGVLQAAGHETVEPGSRLRVQVGRGQKGQQVTAVLEVDASTASSPSPRPAFRSAPRGPSGGRDRPDPSTAVEIEGTVKWYNEQKGYGFVVCEDGDRDVFVHASTVERAGMRGLAEGQRISMRVVKTPKGREAISLTALT